jgi:hypothetical protein
MCQNEKKMFEIRLIIFPRDCRPLLGWLLQVYLEGLVNFRLAFDNYRNVHLPHKGLVDFTSSQISYITL